MSTGSTSHFLYYQNARMDLAAELRFERGCIMFKGSMEVKFAARSFIS
jgi:hypothetical protein